MSSPPGCATGRRSPRSPPAARTARPPAARSSFRPGQQQAQAQHRQHVLHLAQLHTGLAALQLADEARDRKSDGWGTRVSVRVDPGGRRNIKKKKINNKKNK